MVRHGRKSTNPKGAAKMNSNTFLQRTWGRHANGRQCRAGSSRRLVLEVLEDRTVPAAVPILSDTSMLASPIAAPAVPAPAAAPVASAAATANDLASAIQKLTTDLTATLQNVVKDLTDTVKLIGDATTAAVNGVNNI